MIARITQSKHFWPVVIVLLFGVLAARHLFTPGYFNMHDDLQMLRQLEMEKCFLDGQIPCRWTPDMAYEYGFAMFNFYPPLPYLVGQGIRLLGFSFINTAKILFAIAFLASGVTMYALAKEFFGRFATILVAVFYIWAPYHSVDIFVRGAMNESWALIWFPAIAWTSYKLIRTNKKFSPWIIGLALSWFGLLTSHNLMVMIFAPVFALWVFLWLFRHKAWNRIPHLVISGIWALGMAAFFTLPAVVENKYTQIEQALVGYYDYTAHFADINQIFISRFWGYGPSVWTMTEDKMSFQAGHLHWGLSMIAMLLVGIKLYRTKKFKDKYLAVLFLGLSGWFAAFMVHARSIFIYQLIPPLGYVQFPWRFLALVIFGMSFAVGFIPLAINKKWRRLVSIVLMFGLVVLNWTYFRPEYGKLGPLTDEQKFSGEAWEKQITSGIYDYLPGTAKTAPKAKQEVVAEIVEGDAQLISGPQGTDWVDLEVRANEASMVRINTLMFPGWKVFTCPDSTMQEKRATDGCEELEVLIPEQEEWGRMHVSIPEGTHHLRAVFTDTPIRILGNSLSLLAWGTLIATPFFLKVRK